MTKALQNDFRDASASASSTTASPCKMVYVIVRDLDGPGSVARVAKEQTIAFHPDVKTVFLTNTFSSTLPNQVTQVIVRTKSYNQLRRFSHVPREMAFARAVNEELIRVSRSGTFPEWVISHSHVVAAVVSRIVKRSGAKLALCVHGDVIDRPIKTYGLQLSALYRIAARVAYPRCDRIFVLSRHSKLMATRLGAKSNRIQIVPHGLDSEVLFTPRPRDFTGLGTSALPLELLYVGRLSPEKGVDILLNACAILDKQSISWRLTIVGDGMSRKALSAQSLALGISKNVRFVGQVSRNEALQAMRESHIVCMPSRSEPFGLVALEAMASGSVLMASPVGGLEDTLSCGGGILVTENIPSRWAESIISLCRKSDAYNDIANSAWLKVKNEYQWDAISRSIKTELFGSPRSAC